jgi:hypothetical protein
MEASVRRRMPSDRRGGGFQTAEGTPAHGDAPPFAGRRRSVWPWSSREGGGYIQPTDRCGDDGTGCSVAFPRRGTVPLPPAHAERIIGRSFARRAIGLTDPSVTFQRPSPQSGGRGGALPASSALHREVVSAARCTRALAGARDHVAEGIVQLAAFAALFARGLPRQGEAVRAFRRKSWSRTGIRRSYATAQRAAGTGLRGNRGARECVRVSECSCRSRWASAGLREPRAFPRS